jgi:competence protein ComEC
VRAQWAASLVLVPLAGFWFGAIPVAGPLANALAIPLVSSLITPLAMGGAAIASLSEAAAWLPLWIATVATQALITALSWVDALPLVLWTTGSSSWTSLVLAAAGAWLVLTPARPLSRLAAAALMLPLLTGRGDAFVDGQWSMQIIDVGQGTAVLVRTGRHTLLYDTGPTYGREGEGAGDRIIAPWLRHQGIHRLDRLVLSHEDRDHSGGAAELVRQFAVAGMTSSLPEGHALRSLPVAHETCTRGRHWQWDGVRFEILHPGPEEIATPGKVRSNARSCVLRISSPAGSALLTGDIEAAQEAQLVRLYGNSGLGSDVLMVPHHGSGTSSSAIFLDTVAPAVAVVQAGYRNRFRHPAARVVARYRARGIELLRTDHAGAMAIRFEPGRRRHIVRARTDDAPYWRIVTAPPVGGGSH